MPQRPALPRPRAGARGPARASGRRRGGVTGRAAVLALVVCGLALSLAYPTREFFSQRAEIAALHERVAAAQAQVAALEADKARWDDPAYVKAQARSRLHFVMPGETQYVVVDLPPSDEAASAATDLRATDPGSARDDAWFQRLWASTQMAARS